MQSKPLLVDLGGLSACCTDHALEGLAKAISGEDGDAHDIWEPHHNPFIQRIIELFTARGLVMLEHVQTALMAWADGKLHNPAAKPVAKPAPYVQNWTPEESSLVHLYLTSLPAEAFTFSDYSLLVDYLLHSYMPETVLRTEAEWFAVRSSILGRVQAVMDGKAPTVPELDPLIAAMPLTIAAAQKAFKFSKLDAIMEYGNARCAEQVVGLAASARQRLKKAIMEHTYKRMTGDPIATRQDLQQKLLDEFATLNRDWRRIALTEAGENANQGMLATLTPGSRVKRIEQYKGACPFCKRIDGAVMEVVPADAPDKDGDKQVWPGKTNIGRSSAARKRVGDELVERLPSEMWWIPAGTVHPHCRGGWHLMPEAGVHDDADFQKWLDQHFHKNKQSPTSGNHAQQ
jgi:hypothetical protein